MTRTKSARRISLAAIVSLALALAPASGAPTATTGSKPPKGGSRVGVSRRVIKIGMHAPLTGAAPVPSQSMDQGKDLFYRWIAAKDRFIHGRRVRVILKNDNFSPSQAVAVCKEMVEEDKVFALVGYAGIDQMQACARYAASVGVPYLAPGTTEIGLEGLPQTFVTTMTWSDQGPLMTDFLISKLKGRKKKNAIVWVDTVLYRDAKRAFVRAMHRRNASVYSRPVDEDATAVDATAVVQDLETRSVKNVYVLVTPVFFLQMMKAASDASYSPQWTGIDQGITTETVASSACANNDQFGGAKFFSPYPAFGDRDKFDKNFDKAMGRFHQGDNGDAYVWGNWAQQKAIARLLRRPGRNLTRKRFVWFAERAKSIRTGVGPRLHYRPKDHFGADQVHLLRANCSDKRWHTIRSFVSDF